MKLSTMRDRMDSSLSYRTGGSVVSSRSTQAAQPSATSSAHDQAQASCAAFPVKGRFYLFSKRLFDILFSSAVIVCTLPVTMLVALGIRLDSCGPIFFSQQRVGKDGKLFTIYKFRSMQCHSPKYACTPVDDCQDSRVTRVGKILRQSGLDELPQFFNVLRGDMSVVGPRPEMPFLVEQYNDRERARLYVTPGITGPWQLSAARCQPICENLQYDEEYIRRRSMGYDLLIVAKTAILTLKLLTRVFASPACKRDVRRDIVNQ